MSCFPAKSLEVAVKFSEETWHNKILYTFMLTTRDAGGELTTSAHLLAYMHASIHIIISSVFWVDLMTYVARIRGYGYRYAIRGYSDTPFFQKQGYGDTPIYIKNKNK